MEPQSGIILMKPPSHPPSHPPTHPPAAHLFLTDPMTTGSLFWCAVSPPPPSIGPLFRKYVRCPPPPHWHPVQKICAVSPLPVSLFSVRCPPPQFSSVPWTLWLCLGFWAKLRIWQVPACKMKPSSTCILECGTPSWACLLNCYSYMDLWYCSFLTQTLTWQVLKSSNSP